MYTLLVTLKNGKTFPIDFYSYQVAVDCARDHLTAPDVANAEVVSKTTGEVVWYAD